MNPGQRQSETLSCLWGKGGKAGGKATSVVQGAGPLAEVRVDLKLTLKSSWNPLQSMSKMVILITLLDKNVAELQNYKKIKLLLITH